MGFEKSNSEDNFTKKYLLRAACIIPAAGLSSRMGCWKGELKTVKGYSFLENAVSTARQACRKVIVVGGYQYPCVQKILSQYRNIDILCNENYERGMLSSIQKGLELVNEDFFIFPMDMPLIQPNVFFTINEHCVTGKIIRPTFNHIPGHPVLFPERWKEIILKMKGEHLGKQIRPSDLEMIPWEDATVITDIDSMAEYQSYSDQA